MRFLRLPAVLLKAGLSKTSVYRLIKRREFPAPVKAGSISLWLEDDVNQWIQKMLQK